MSTGKDMSYSEEFDGGEFPESKSGLLANQRIPEKTIINFVACHCARQKTIWLAKP